MVYKFFDNKSKGSGIKNEIRENQHKLMNFINQLLGSLKKEKYIFPIKIIYGVVTWKICNY